MLRHRLLGHGKGGALWILVAAAGFSTVSLALTYPSPHSGIHESDSALYVVEAVSLSQTSPLDPQPEWNSVVRIAALPWGGLHVLVLRLGLALCGPSSDACEFRAGCLFKFWSGVGAASVLLAALLGYLLRGAWGAFWSAGLVAASAPHIAMYTQFNQLGTVSLFALLTLTAGAWRTLRPDRLGSAVLLGVTGFLHPFADNMVPMMWLAFPVYLWLALPHPDRQRFVRAIAPYGIGTALAVAAQATLIGLRWATGATAYDATLFHFIGRVVSLLASPSGYRASGTAGLTLLRSPSAFGAGLALAAILAALYAAARVRTRRDLCLAPVALMYTLPLLLVPQTATLVTEYLHNGLTLLLLAIGIIVAHAWSSEWRGTGWAVAGRVATVMGLALVMASSRGAMKSARSYVAGESWAGLGSRLARLPPRTIVASTAEEEVGILYTGRRILTRNDASASDLAPLFEAWPARIDYLVIRPAEQEVLAPVIDKRHLQLMETVSDGAQDEWRIFRAPEDAPGAVPRDAPTNGTCSREPYIPNSFDASWRYPPGSVLRQWGVAGLLQGDPQLWLEWSRATRLPYERFAGADAPKRPSSPAAVGGRS